MEFSVSAPKELLLVRVSAPGILETTLVVPDLPEEELPYARFLVDEGSTFAEHAVARCPREFTLEEQRVVRRALSLARPTRVSFLVADESLVFGEDLEKGGSVWAALAVAQAVRPEVVPSGAPESVQLVRRGGAQEKEERRFFVAPLGQFFVCRAT
jgi:hypothetical protein